MLPTKERWTFIVSREPSGFHTRYHADADLGRVAMTLRRLDRPVEQLRLAVVGGAAARSGSITMTWEQTTVSAGFMVGQ